MKRYHAIAPGWPYAGTFYGKDKKAVKAVIRKYLRVERLPNGLTIWES